MRRGKKFTERQLQERNRIEAELEQIQPMCDLARKITSPAGFYDYYLQMRDLYDTQTEAYERLEDFHIAITGHRKYAEFDSFRGVSVKNLS